ncbi:MAG TPA: amidohydrolase family protein, partial [Thermoanaerobaculia bacterium]|nr:amidohydrolase family protein [Thermoanaerobaculia bacterium]
SRRAVPCAVLVALAGCAAAPGSPRVAAGPADAVVAPVADYHQHLMSPALVELWGERVLPPVELPEALDRVLRERERVAGTSGAGELYTEDARMVELSPWSANWIGGQDAIRDLISRVRPGSRMVPNGFGIDGSSAYVAASVFRGEGPSARNVANILFVLRRDPDGSWRIAAESGSIKPPGITAPVTADQLVVRLDEAGIRQAVVLSGAYAFGSLEAPPGADEYARVRAENDWTAEQVARYPDRLIGFCAFNPVKEYAVAELERCAGTLRLRGLKLHLGNSGVDVRNPAHVEQLRRVFRAANRLRLAITIHLRTPDPSYGREHSLIFLGQVLPQAPEVPVQVAHLAGTGPGYGSDEALAPLAEAVAAGDPRTRNLYFDLATNVTPTISAESARLIARRIRQIGTERILFGSDLDPATSPRQEWGTFRGMIPLTDAEFRAIADNRLPYLPGSARTVRPQGSILDSMLTFRK